MQKFNCLVENTGIWKKNSELLNQQLNLNIANNTSEFKIKSNRNQKYKTITWLDKQPQPT